MVAVSPVCFGPPPFHILSAMTMCSYANPCIPFKSHGLTLRKFLHPFQKKWTKPPKSLESNLSIVRSPLSTHDPSCCLPLGHPPIQTGQSLKPLGHLRTPKGQSLKPLGHPRASSGQSGLSSHLAPRALQWQVSGLSILAVMQPAWAVARPITTSLCPMRAVAQPTRAVTQLARRPISFTTTDPPGKSLILWAAKHPSAQHSN
jgi:hypothetical protein